MQITKQNKLVLSLIAIAILTFVIYSNSLTNGYTHWDDHLYVAENPDIEGFTLQNLTNIFSTVYVGNYAPVQMLSYIVDYLIWGKNLFGYHLTNLNIHIINSIIIFLIISTFFKKDIFLALTVSLLFSLHPVNVESVSWLSQRKNVLSMLFFLSSIFLYLKFLTEDKNKKRVYVLSVIFFLLSLLTKAVTVTLPVLLILIEYTFFKRSDKLLKNKIPFFLIAAAFSLITIYTQDSSDAIGRSYEGGVYSGMLTTFRIIFSYIRFLIFPVNMSADYVPKIYYSILNFVPLISLISLLFLTFLVFKYRVKKVIFFSYFWFFITLGPVLNIIPLATLMADRYLYYPSIGFCVLAAYFFKKCLNMDFNKRSVIFLILVLSSFSLLTHKRNKIWEGDYSLWTDSLKKSPQSVPTLNNLSYYLALNNIDLDRALLLSKRALLIDPENLECLDTLAEIYIKKEDFENAGRILNKALTIDPKNVTIMEKLRKINIKQK